MCAPMYTQMYVHYIHRAMYVYLSLYHFSHFTACSRGGGRAAPLRERAALWSMSSIPFLQRSSWVDYTPSARSSSVLLSDLPILPHTHTHNTTAALENGFHLNSLCERDNPYCWLFFSLNECESNILWMRKSILVTFVINIHMHKIMCGRISFVKFNTVTVETIWILLNSKKNEYICVDTG